MSKYNTEDKAKLNKRTITYRDDYPVLKDASTVSDY